MLPAMRLPSNVLSTMSSTVLSRAHDWYMSLLSGLPLCNDANTAGLGPSYAARVRLRAGLPLPGERYLHAHQSTLHFRNCMS
jgi:hypothetical protein